MIKILFQILKKLFLTLFFLLELDIYHDKHSDDEDQTIYIEGIDQK